MVEAASQAKHQDTIRSDTPGTPEPTVGVSSEALRRLLLSQQFKSARPTQWDSQSTVDSRTADWDISSAASSEQLNNGQRDAVNIDNQRERNEEAGMEDEDPRQTVAIPAELAEKFAHLLTEKQN